jgi:AraC family transcriptional regulator
MSQRLPSGTFFGRTGRVRESGRLRLVETLYAAGATLGQHQHERAYLALVLRGSYEERVARVRRGCEPWTVTIHPAGEEHSEVFHQGGGVLLNVEIAPEMMDDLGEHASLLAEPSAHSGGLMATLAVRLADEFARWDSVAPLAIEGLVLELLAVTGRRSATGESHARWMRDVLDFLHAEFRRRPLVLAEVAAVAGVHPGHLSRTFKRHQGVGVADYVRRLRVEYACRELTGSARPIALIAQDAGFADQAHLSHVFQSVVGTSPARFRTRSR